MNETIILRGVEVAIDSAVGQEFVRDAVRAAESLVDDAELMAKFELSLEELQKIATNKAVGHAIRAERERRVRSGLAAKEAAARIFVRAPKVMGTILDNEQASPRHRIEASRELRATAIGSGDSERPMDSERFVIRIDLSAGGGPVEHFDKAIKVDVNDTPPDAPEPPKLTKPEQPKLTIISDEANNE
jgi:hypothetical protein